MVRAAVALSVCALYLMPLTARAWGIEGHRLIAAIAAKHLKQQAADKVKELLADGETLESVAAWADRVRPDRPETSTWHYINIPIGEVRVPSSPDQWKKFCPSTGCTVSALEMMASKVRNTSLPRTERAEALMFLVHFVGDMHQPLHTGDRADKGGNGVQLIYRGRATNLHSVWDTPLLADWLSANPRLKEKVQKGPGWWSRRTMGNGSVSDWLWETRNVARDVAYGNLPNAKPAQIGDDYLESAGPVIVLQIERAGVRLARILNACLAEGEHSAKSFILN